MTGKRVVCIVAVGFLLALVAGLTLAQGPQSGAGQAPEDVVGTAFTYQGLLRKAGAPVDAACDLKFGLWDADPDGSQIGDTLSRPAVPLSDGLFTVQLDFGEGVFQSDARYLEIAVLCPGDPDYVTLAPRQALTPAPYALALPGLWTQQNGTSPNLIGGHSENSVTAGVYGATISGGGGATYYANRVTDQYGVVGGGAANRAGNDAGGLSDGEYATVSGGYGNKASGQCATIGGGLWNTASNQDATICGGASNTAGGWIATVGGGLSNTASGQYATVPGGENNQAQGDYAFAAGRRAKANSAGCFVWADSTDADFACNTANQFAVRATGGVSLTVDTAGGGLRIEPNAASPNLIGGYSGNRAGAGLHGVAIGGGGESGHINQAIDTYTTIAGGWGNTAGGYAATVGGGEGNTTSSWHATVAGGKQNTAGGQYATVPGGRLNEAQGNYSFAAGRRAKANNEGCFVWGDANDADVACSGGNRWVARSSGGVWFYTNAAMTAGVWVDAGGTSWNSISDRATKENFSPADTQAILRHLASLPVQEYNLKSQAPSIRHVGLVAQDFATFGYGESDKAINMQDADGMALAAIQGLYEQNQALTAENAARQVQIDALEARLAALEAEGQRGPSRGAAAPGGWLLLGSGLAVTAVVVGRSRRGGER